MLYSIRFIICFSENTFCCCLYITHVDRMFDHICEYFYEDDSLQWTTFITTLLVFGLYGVEGKLHITEQAKSAFRRNQKFFSDTTKPSKVLAFYTDATFVVRCMCSELLGFWTLTIVQFPKFCVL
jgi:hypothetical protein